MNYTLHVPGFDPNRYPESPELEVGKEFVKLAVSKLTFAAGTATFRFHVTFMLPLSVEGRYQAPGEAFVVIVNDIDQQDCFSARTSNDFIRYPPGVRDGPNLVGEPRIPLEPLPLREGEGFGGGWINGEISFASPGPRHAPSIFVYLVFENYVSNVVAFDLMEEKVVSY